MNIKYYPNDGTVINEYNISKNIGNSFNMEEKLNLENKIEMYENIIKDYEKKIKIKKDKQFIKKFLIIIFTITNLIIIGKSILLFLNYGLTTNLLSKSIIILIFTIFSTLNMIEIKKEQSIVLLTQELTILKHNLNITKEKLNNLSLAKNLHQDNKPIFLISGRILEEDIKKEMNDTYKNHYEEIKRTRTKNKQ